MVVKALALSDFAGFYTKKAVTSWRWRIKKGKWFYVQEQIES
uniref:Uncharacterized protein n=1 Tax=Meloidogyne enterolobii TaxID=390850 RepID=A0A6V7X4S3_MELEN|nr:unnamed protein product [Meloidogyne enterolobii]